MKALLFAGLMLIPVQDIPSIPVPKGHPTFTLTFPVPPPETAGCSKGWCVMREPELEGLWKRAESCKPPEKPTDAPWERNPQRNV